MSKRLIFSIAALATVGLSPVAANAEPVPPACVVLKAAPVNVQLGYAPNGPSGCTQVTPPAQ